MVVFSKWTWLTAAAVLLTAAVWFVKQSYPVASWSFPAASTFYNPIVSNGADPWVVKHTDGYYYMTFTTGNNINVWKSASLSGIAGGDRKVVWTPPAAGPNSKGIWAPELHWLDGKWYIYYAADDGSNPHHRMFVLESAGTDALGPYVSKGQITDSTNRWAIDGTVLTKDDGSRYFIWSGWEGDVNVRQNLYIAPMSSPYTISGDRVEISQPTYPWEKVGAPLVNEGPQVLTRNGKIFVVFSASGSWTDDYCLGMLTADMTSDVLNPAWWVKSSKPVFAKSNGVFGPGHHSFTTSPDGKEDWLVYHAARYSKAGWDRQIRIQKFGWRDDGTPDFGTPASANSPLTVPSGDPIRTRYEAEKAVVHNAEAVEHPAASGGQKLVFAEGAGDAYADFKVVAGQAGTYMLTLRYGNGVREGKRSELRVTANSGNTVPVALLSNPSWNVWTNANVKVELHAGENAIRVTRSSGQAEIDCIDISPAG